MRHANVHTLISFPTNTYLLFLCPLFVHQVVIPAPPLNDIAPRCRATVTQRGRFRVMLPRWHRVCSSMPVVMGFFRASCLLYDVTAGPRRVSKAFNPS